MTFKYNDKSHQNWHLGVPEFVGYKSVAKIYIQMRKKYWAHILQIIFTNVLKMEMLHLVKIWAKILKCV